MLFILSTLTADQSVPRVLHVYSRTIVTQSNPRFLPIACSSGPFSLVIPILKIIITQLTLLSFYCNNPDIISSIVT